MRRSTQISPRFSGNTKEKYILSPEDTSTSKNEEILKETVLDEKCGAFGVKSSVKHFSFDRDMKLFCCICYISTKFDLNYTELTSAGKPHIGDLNVEFALRSELSSKCTLHS